MQTLRLIPVFLSAMFCCANSYAQSGEALNGPVLVVDSPVYNFGEVLEGPTIKHSYRIRNAGNQVLVIQGCSPNGGGVEVDYPRGPIPPGKTANIVVDFGTRGRFGYSEKSIHIRSNAINSDPNPWPPYTLFIKGRVFRAHEIPPSERSKSMIRID